MFIDVDSFQCVVVVVDVVVLVVVAVVVIVVVGFGSSGDGCVVFVLVPFLYSSKIVA